MFDNEINKMIAQISGLMNEMKFKIALRDGFHQMINIKDDYVMMKNG